MSWQSPENLSADGIVDLFTGTPDGTLFLRDDGTLALPSGGSGGAPTDASYVALGTNATLTNERVLTGTTNQIAITDNGAGGTVVLSTPQNLHTAATPQFASLELGHASDTTLTRASAGVLAVEGVNVLLANILTANGDLLTRTAGVPAPLALGTALHGLRVNAAGTGLEYAAISGGFTPQYARISRGTSDQTGISGSFAEDYLQYNSEDTDPDGLVTISGDDVTFAAAGTYLILQHVYGMGGGFFSLHINGTHVNRIQTNGATYEALPRILITTGANQVVKFVCVASAAATMAYTDSARVVNFVEILRIA
jgi:hypothetical protein